MITRKIDYLREANLRLQVISRQVRSGKVSKQQYAKERQEIIEFLLERNRTDQFNALIASALTGEHVAVDNWFGRIRQLIRRS